MQDELFRLQDDVEALQNYVKNLDIGYVCSELNTICARENGPAILQILLNVLSFTAGSQEKRMKIARKVVENIENEAIPDKLVEKLVGVLSTQMESFSTDNIITLIDCCLQMMRDRKNSDGYKCWKDFIPKLLNKVVEEDFIQHNGTRMKGSEYKSEIIIAICIFDWPNEIITDIASMLIDISLTPDEHLKIVNKLCKGILSISLQEIPPLVHQMLQLTKEQHFMPLFLALAQLFEKKIYSDSSDVDCDLKEIQAVEGTVLYHIYTIVSGLGPQSVKDFVKTLKECVNSPGFILTPFTLTLMLTISCVSYTFEEEVLSIIKSAIQRNFAEEERIFDSAWIDSIVPAGVTVNHVFEKIIMNSSRERDKVVKGLINLGFSLLSTHKLRGRELQIDKIWDLGTFILIRITNKYSDLTGSILQTLANLIPQVHESSQYTDLLFHLVRKNPMTVLDCSTVMIQLLDTICGKLSGTVGRRVIAVILPLTKMSHSFRDNLVILLRKSLFSRDRECREVAVTGILELLKNLKISNLKTLSQSTSQSYRGLTQIYSQACGDPAASSSNEGLCLELLYMLREVFKHQHEIKTVFYKGLYECVYVNPELGFHALDILQSHFDQFYKPWNDIPPLDFEKTVTLQGNKSVLLEPLAQLTLTIGLILAKVNENSTECGKLKEMFSSLCQRMSDADVPYFLSKEPCDGSPEGSMKEEEIRQIMGVYEALMGYTLCIWNVDSSQNGETLNSLFRAYCRISDFTRNLGKSDKEKVKDTVDKKKEKSRISPFKFPQSILNFKCVCRLLSILYENSLPWASEGSVALVKNKRELHRYCLNTILALLKQAKSVPATELSKDTPSLGYLTKIGRLIYVKCVQRVGEMAEFDRASTVIALECFAELIQLVLTNFQAKFTAFLGDICCNTSLGANELLKSVLLDLVDQLNTILKYDLEDEAKEEEAQFRKASILLVTICTSLSSQLARGPEAQQVMEKAKKICKEVKVESPTIAKPVLSFLLSLYAKTKFGSLLLDLTLCLCDNMPLIDDEMKVVEHTVYNIVNSKTANACVTAVCDSLRVHVNHIEWVVARLKSELLILSHSTKNSEERTEDLCERERELCRQITYSMRILSILCTIAIPPGVYADAVLRELGNFYNKLTIVTKYFILKVGKYHHQLLDSKFEKTVKLVDHDLSKNMYCFTEHVISEGTSGIDQSKKDPALLKMKSLRETKIIPKVIFEKEQFQKFVIQLSNKAKINMVGQTKHALARDYRLYGKQVKEILEKENIQLEDMEVENNDIEGENEEKSKKRPRLED